MEDSRIKDPCYCPECNCNNFKIDFKEHINGK